MAQITLVKGIAAKPCQWSECLNMLPREEASWLCRELPENWGSFH